MAEPAPGRGVSGGSLVYITYLPSLERYQDRVAQVCHLADHFAQVILIGDEREPALPGPLPSNLSYLPLWRGAQRGGIARMLQLGRTLFRVIGAHRGRQIIIDDWFFFAAPSFPLIRIWRRLAGHRVALLFSPVTSHRLWFTDNSLRVLWQCLDFSLWRGRRLPLEAWALLWADAVCVQSDGLRSRYQKILGRKPVFAAPNAIPTQDTAPPAPAETDAPRRALLYAGNLSLNKGLDLILALDRPDFRARFAVTLVGEGHRREGRRLEAQLGESGFRLLPWQTPEQLAGLYRDSDILILPTRHEGMPRVATEFLALNKPVVISDLPGLSDIRSPLLLRFPKGDGAAFEAAIENAAAMLPLAHETIEKNTMDLYRFSPEATARRKAEGILHVCGVPAGRSEEPGPQRMGEP